MSFRILVCFMVLLLSGSTAWAGKNVITVGSVSYPQGTLAAEIEVSMTNDDTVGGIQFDLLIPSSLTPSDLDANPKTFDAIEHGKHSISLDYIVGSGIDDDVDGVVDRVRVLIFSISGKSIDSGSGGIAKLYFDVDEKAESDTYLLSLEGVVLSDPAGSPLTVTTENGDITITESDDDKDGFPNSEDCNDNDASVYPGADEIAYDSIDQDCDGEDLTDVDGDGYDAIEADGEDCDDEDAAVNPGAKEIAYDDKDQDCDGFDLTDVDGDGYDADIVPDGEDCDDTDPEIHPDAIDDPDDGIDQDCDGADSTSSSGDTDDTAGGNGAVDDSGLDGASGCGCATSAPWSPAAITGLMIFVVLRRRRQGSVELC